MSEQKTLRDEIAIEAMKSILSSRQYFAEEGVAAYSYALADAMMAERAKNAPKDDGGLVKCDGPIKDDSVWIEWNGKDEKLPVSPGTIVEVNWQHCKGSDVGMAAMWNGCYVKSYRLVK